MSHPSDDTPSPRASATTTTPPPVRCPRCGSRTGALDAAHDADDVSSGDRYCDRYCGCCGLIVSVAR